MCCYFSLCVVILVYFWFLLTAQCRTNFCGTFGNVSFFLPRNVTDRRRETDKRTSTTTCTTSTRGGDRLPPCVGVLGGVPTFNFYSVGADFTGEENQNLVYSFQSLIALPVSHELKIDLHIFIVTRFANET